MTAIARYHRTRDTKSLTNKSGMIMKLMIALLLFCTTELTANGYAQKVTIVKKAMLLS